MVPSTNCENGGGGVLCWLVGSFGDFPDLYSQPYMNLSDVGQKLCKAYVSDVAI